MAIKREKIQPQGIHVRMMAGQPAYTQVVTVSGTGRQNSVAGQLGPATQKAIAPARAIYTARSQQVEENVKTCLAAAGATLSPDFMIEIEAIALVDN